MRKLARASAELAQGLPEAKALPQLDEESGTHEVRQAASVFNAMARRLQQQFDARSLHMAAVSHDLRTPLTRMRMRLENSADPSARASIADIREMDELVASSLAVLREQRDAMPPGVIDLGALLQAMVDDLADAGQAVETGELPPLRVRAHSASLRRVIGNVVGNALRHGGSARVFAREEGGRAIVTIDDDGPGIPPEHLERVFEPWVRLQGDRAQVGHGLGLAIARDLAERDGGMVTLANRAQGGLRAEVTLPLA
jgi:protein-histidine pros-kinase